MRVFDENTFATLNLKPTLTLAGHQALVVVFLFEFTVLLCLDQSRSRFDIILWQIKKIENNLKRPIFTQNFTKSNMCVFIICTFESKAGFIY